MSCVICHSKSFQFLFEKNNYRIEKCLGCRLVQVTNIPPLEQIEEEYDQDFYTEHYGDLERNGKKQRYEYLNFNNKLDQIEKRIERKGNILDVGCSFGFFLDAARHRGWRVAGIEISEHAAKYAAERLKLVVLNKPIIEADFEQGSFDVITMWAVIEHLPNPKEILQHLSKLLKDDGMLVVHTGNVDSYRARIEGRRWRQWIPPVHLLYFSPQVMRTLFKQCDLQLVDQETCLPYEKYFRKARLYSLLNKLKLSDNVIYYAKKMDKQVPAINELQLAS
jgi:2-polyprenyl-3-methyl-5-hydroxy-6-metoxy-1,4-benzoquinol methylase